MGEAAARGGDTRRLLIMASVVVVVALVFVLGFARGCSPRDPMAGYTVVYSNMDLKDAANVVTQLKTLKIPYQIRDNGRSIAVPKDKADEARLGLAEKNLPTGGSVGWEIFDTSKLGTTDFDRRIQFVRAISGELSRTISRIDAVQDARIQIVIPQTTLFEVTKVPVTASVLLQLRNGRSLNKDQVNGIVRLVASSVENLRPENVIIVDIYGNILSGPSAVEPETVIGGPVVEAEEQPAEIKEMIIPKPVTKEAAPAAIPVTKEAVKEMPPQKPAPVTVQATPEKIAPQAAVETLPSKEVKVIEFREEALKTPEEKALQRLKSKEELENRLSSKAQMLVNKFYPPNSILVKVSVDLGKSAVKKQFKKPARAKAKGKSSRQKQKKKSYAGEIKKMTVIVLVDNRFNLTKKLKKNTFSTIAGALSYRPSRGDKIIVTQVPFHYATAYQSQGFKKRHDKFPSMTGAFGIAGLIGFAGRNMWWLVLGLFVIIVWIGASRRKKKISTAGKAGTGQKREAPKAPSAVDQMRKAVSNSPDKVAKLIERWLSDEERGK